MTEKPLVSVIINCYNGEKYLREAIDSVIAQTYENWELVFWDNQSTDSTREIVVSYGDPRIHYFYAPKHTPLGEARNLAVEKANGSLAAYIDVDDIWLPTFLAECISIFRNNPSLGLIYTRFINFEGGKKWLSPGSNESNYIDLKRLCRSYNVGMSASMFNISAVRRSGLFFDTRFSLIEDYDFFLHIASISKVYYIAVPQMLYRWHEGNLTKSDGWLKEFQMFYTKTLDTLSLKPISKVVRKYCEYIEVRTLLQKKKKIKALGFIIQHMWMNPLLLKYMYPVIFGMDSFHNLRTRCS